MKLKLIGDIPPVERQLRALGFGVLYATLLAALVDAAAIPFDVYRTQPGLLVQVPTLSLLKACEVFLPNLGLLALLALCVLQPQSRLITRLMPWLGTLWAVGNALWTLTRYEKFAGQVSVWAGFSGLFLALGFWVSKQRLHTWPAGSGGWF